MTAPAEAPPDEEEAALAPAGAAHAVEDKERGRRQMTAAPARRGHLSLLQNCAPKLVKNHAPLPERRPKSDLKCVAVIIIVIICQHSR